MGRARGVGEDGHAAATARVVRGARTVGTVVRVGAVLQRLIANLKNRRNTGPSGNKVKKVFVIDFEFRLFIRKFRTQTTSAPFLTV